MFWSLWNLYELAYCVYRQLQNQEERKLRLWMLVLRRGCRAVWYRMLYTVNEEGAKYIEQWVESKWQAEEWSLWHLCFFPFSGQQSSSILVLQAGEFQQLMASSRLTVNRVWSRAFSDLQGDIWFCNLFSLLTSFVFSQLVVCMCPLVCIDSCKTCCFTCIFCPKQNSQ